VDSLPPWFFLPVKVLSRLFRGKFIALLCEAREDNQLIYTGQLSHLAEVDEFNSWLRQLWQVEWVVYAKPPFGVPQQVLKYLARYTHRVAISNGRLLELNDGRVTFSYKDYAAGNAIGTMALETQEFARRFLLHVLPRGFVRMRYYGFLANCHRREKLELCRRLLSTQREDTESIAEIPKDGQLIDPAAAHPICPNCGQRKMIIIEKISAEKRMGLSLVFPIPAANTS
jgi:Putative transposase